MATTIMTRNIAPKAISLPQLCRNTAIPPNTADKKYKNRTACLCDNPTSKSRKCRCFLSPTNGDDPYHSRRTITQAASMIGIPRTNAGRIKIERQKPKTPGGKYERQKSCRGVQHIRRERQTKNHDTSYSGDAADESIHAIQEFRSIRHAKNPEKNDKASQHRKTAQFPLIKDDLAAKGVGNIRNMNPAANHSERRGHWKNYLNISRQIVFVIKNAPDNENKRADQQRGNTGRGNLIGKAEKRQAHHAKSKAQVQGRTAKLRPRLVVDLSVTIGNILYA